MGCYRSPEAESGGLRNRGPFAAELCPQTPPTPTPPHSCPAPLMPGSGILRLVGCSQRPPFRTESHEGWVVAGLLSHRMVGFRGNWEGSRQEAMLEKGRCGFFSVGCSGGRKRVLETSAGYPCHSEVFCSGARAFVLA